jgi:hypothetical protein
MATEADKPFYSRGSFWAGPFTWGLGLVIAVGIGIAWYVIGGFPADHDKYGTVAVPGQRVFDLPEGDVRLNFEGDTVGSGDSRSIQDQPDGLEVRVTPAGGGDPLEVEDVPSWLFSSTSGDRGHEPFGKVDIPSEGSYRVQATADGLGGFDSPAASRDAPGADTGPVIAVGAKPWNPLGSPVLGAIIAACVVGLVIALLSLPLRLVR